MLKSKLIKLAGGLLLIAMLAVLTACGSTTPASPASEKPPAAEQPTPDSPAPPTTSTPPTPPPASDLLAEGKAIYMERAGGVGCQACHGAEGKGSASVGGPDIRGKTETEVRSALVDVAMMSNIKLTDQEITAVVEYLQYLNK